MKRFLLPGALWIVMAACLWQNACAQGTQPESGNVSAAGKTQDQQANPQPAPSPSTNVKKGNASSATDDQSSTVGDPATSGPLNVKGKLRYFAVETFRPGIYPVAAFYDGLTMANPPKSLSAGMAAGIPRICPQLWRLYGQLGLGSGRKVRGCLDPA